MTRSTDQPATRPTTVTVPRLADFLAALPDDPYQDNVDGYDGGPSVLPDVEVWYVEDAPLVYIGWYWRPRKVSARPHPEALGAGPFPTADAARQDAGRKRT